MTCILCFWIQTENEPIRVGVAPGSHAGSWRIRIFLMDTRQSVSPPGRVYFAVGGSTWQSCLWRMMASDGCGSGLTDVGDHPGTRRAFTYDEVAEEKCRCASPGPSSITREARTTAKKTHRAHTGWNVSSILPNEGCVLRKQDAIAIHSLLTLQWLRTPFKARRKQLLLSFFNHLTQHNISFFSHWMLK